MMHSLSIPNLVQIKKTNWSVLGSSHKASSGSCFVCGYYPRGKHGRVLALLTVIYLAIDTCGISSSLFFGNMAGPWHYWLVIPYQLTHEGLSLHYSWGNTARLNSSDFDSLAIDTSGRPSLPLKPIASIHLIGVCVWYGVVAWGDNGGKGGGGGGGGVAPSFPLPPPSHLSLCASLSLNSPLFFTSRDLLLLILLLRWYASIQAEPVDLQVCLLIPNARYRYQDIDDRRQRRRRFLPIFPFLFLW